MVEVEQHSVEDKSDHKPECPFQDSPEARCHRTTHNILDLASVSSLQSEEREPRSVGDLVVAGFPAGAAVVEPVAAEADVELPLAENAVLLTFATFLDLLTLAAVDLTLGGHKRTVALVGTGGNVPLVTLPELLRISASNPGQHPIQKVR